MRWLWTNGKATKVSCLILGLLLVGAGTSARERKTLQKKTSAPADPQNRAADAWVDQANTGTNHGGEATLQVSSFNGKNQRALLEFDLSSLSNSGIKLATLSLFMQTAPSGNRTYQARRITSFWRQSDVTWASRFSGIAWTAAGGDNDGITSQTTTTGTTSNVTLSWDVTTAVQQWFGAATPISNYGTEILDGTENSGTARTAVFSSKEATTEANRPSLTVEFVQNVTNFSAQAGNAQVKLTWSYPSSIGTVLSATNGVLIIRSAPNGAVASTVVPTDGTVYSRNATCTNAVSGITVVFSSSTMPTSFTDSAAGDNPNCPPANDSVYTYKIFTKDGNNNYSSDGASSQYVPLLEANPSATASSQWATNWVAPTGVTNLAAPGISPSNVVVLPTNANLVSGVNPQSGSAVFTPFSVAAGISGRPPVLDAADDSIGSGVAYTADAQGFLYATNIATGDLLWISNPTSNTANGFLGGAAAFVKSFAGAGYTRTTDLVVAGTNNTTTTTGNQVMGVDGNTGATVWQYIGGGTNLNMDIVTSTPLVDYTNSVVWVTSHASATTTRPSLWKFSPNNSGTRLLATANLNNISNSPSLSFAGDVLFVGNDTGTFYAVNTSISTMGAAPAASLATADTQVIGAAIVYGKTSPYTVILSTATKVRAVKYTVGSASFTTTGTGTWTTPMPGATGCTPSAPIGFDGLAKVYVGCSDGSIYQLDVATGTIDGSRSIRTGSTLGDSTMDTTLSILVFGSSNSRVYAVPFPF
ncbi:MAG TPA: DNRLRE domain-containing protein [Candidatus Acidoferrum sp.]|nr:DNRLRE domain-containing protein [Candidatus Acidoferrum sp.]